jgi:hypothetical protein
MEGPAAEMRAYKGVGRAHQRLAIASVGRGGNRPFRLSQEAVFAVVVTTQTAHLGPEARRYFAASPSSWMATGVGRTALPRIEVTSGSGSARAIIRTAGELGIKYLTLYAFSVEVEPAKGGVDALMSWSLSQNGAK